MWALNPHPHRPFAPTQLAECKHRDYLQVDLFSGRTHSSMWRFHTKGRAAARRMTYEGVEPWSMSSATFAYLADLPVQPIAMGMKTLSPPPLQSSPRNSITPYHLLVHPPLFNSRSRVMYCSAAVGRTSPGSMASSRVQTSYPPTRPCAARSSTPSRVTSISATVKI